MQHQEVGSQLLAGVLVWQTQEPQQSQVSAANEMLRQHDLGTFTWGPQASCSVAEEVCTSQGPRAEEGDDSGW